MSNNTVALGAFLVALVCLATSGYLLGGLGGFLALMGMAALFVAFGAADGGDTQ